MKLHGHLAGLGCAVGIMLAAVVAGVLDEGCSRTAIPVVPSVEDAGIGPRTACEIAGEAIVVVGTARGLTCQEIKAELETLVAGPTPCRQFFGDAGTVKLACE